MAKDAGDGEIYADRYGRIFIRSGDSYYSDKGITFCPFCGKKIELEASK